MFQIETSVVPGHPEFWDVAVAINAEFFRAVERLEPLLNDVFKEGPAEPLHKVCRHIAKTVCNSLGALLILCANGYGNDAMKVARSMFEGAVNLAYLRRHAEELDDYMDFVWVSSRRLQEFLRVHAPKSFDQISKETLLQSQREYERVVVRFTDTKGRVRSHWCKRPFSQMAAEVGLAAWYGGFYHLASAMQHMSMQGLVGQTEKNVDPRVLDVDVAPSKQWLEQALVAGHVSVVFALEHYVDLAVPEKRDTLAIALEDLRRVWNTDAC